MLDVSSFHCDFLESSVKRSVLFHNLPELVHGGRTYALDLAACKGRLKHVGRIKTARCAACTHYRVELVNEKDYIRICSSLVDDGLESLLEVSAIFSACYY